MSFLTWLEASPVSTWVNQSDSVFAYPMVLFIHTVGLTLLVGINLAVNLRTVGFAPQIPAGDLQKLYPVMWTGLALSIVSGALLLAAKATTMGVNPAFYVKMACVVAAVAIVFGVGAFVLGWKFGDPMSFAAVASVALGGGHLTNAIERKYPPTPDTDIPESA